MTKTEKVFNGRLKRLSFNVHPALMVNSRIEGYSNYTFGGRAGPTVEFTNVLHELAHAAEFGAKNFRCRCKNGGFVFRLVERIVLGHTYYECSTSQPVLRELRVFVRQ